MEITPQVLRAVNNGFNAIFQNSFMEVNPQYARIAMQTQSQGPSEDYGWLKMSPGLREWVGDRVVQNLSAEGYTLKNRKFEKTIAVSADAINDDRVGLWTPNVAQIGRDAALHPDELVYEALKLGTTATCYDGQPFFSASHRGSRSNFADDTGTPWYLFDVSRAVKPLIFQEREAPKFVSLTVETDGNVFMKDEYLFGVKARRAVGYGLWELAYCSEKALTTANYALARSAMMSLKAETGQPLNIVPNLLVVPPSLEEAARKIITAQTVVEGGELISNVWTGTVELLVAPLLA